MNLANPYDLPLEPPADLSRQYRECEFCRLTRTQTINSKDPMRIAGPKKTNGLPSYQMRPVGGACPKCGNDKPEGSFQNPWDRMRGVTVFHGEHGEPTQRIRWAGKHARKQSNAA